jgi:hypothetical protein
MVQAESISTPDPPNKDSNRASRLILVVISILAAICLIILSFVKVTPEVDISLKVTQMSFLVNDSGIAQLFNSVETTSLNLSNYQKFRAGKGTIEVGTDIDARTGEPRSWQPYVTSSGDLTITPTLPYALLNLRKVTVNQLSLTPNSRMKLSVEDAQPNVLLISTDHTTTGEIAASGAFEFSCDSCQINDSSNLESKRLRLTNSRPGGGRMTFDGGDDGMIIGLNLSPSAKLKEQNIELGPEMHFTRLEGGHHLSTITEGKIKIEDTQKDIEIKEGDFVELGGLKNFRIRSIQIDKGINLSLHGQAGELLTGVGGGLKDQRPSRLEWLYAQKAWLLVINALLVMLPILVKILERFGIIAKEK